MISTNKFCSPMRWVLVKYQIPIIAPVSELTILSNIGYIESLQVPLLFGLINISLTFSTCAAKCSPFSLLRS